MLETLTPSNMPSYWNNRFDTLNTPWDMGAPSPALINYFKTINNKNLRVLIPGCGAAHEAEWLIEAGFTDISLVDISSVACEQLINRFKNKCKIYNENFFEHHGTYDLIVEQTFFCALPIDFRNQYLINMSRILVPTGVLAGLLFNKIFDNAGPPFGATLDKYIDLFKPYFSQVNFTNCSLSIPPRAGTELWFEASLPRKN
jgi:SAM-dependent methyltransferase